MIRPVLPRPLARRFLALAVLCWAVSVPCQAVTIEQVPSPRPNGWTVDLTGSLPPETIQALNQLGDEIKAQARGELAVVVVGTIDGADPHDFATRLFNAWGIGDRQANDGLLIFAALDDHAAEIVLGTGIDRPESRHASTEIMQGEMVPRFRAGDPSGAMFQGASAAARRILLTTPPDTGVVGTVLGGGVPSAEVSVPPSMAPEPVREIERIPAYEPPAPSSSVPGAGFWLLLLGLAGVGALVIWKRMPPRCADCRVVMVRLSESGDDLHLEPSEQVEERIGSVNYDVWLCNGCGKMEKRRWTNLFPGYSVCPRCNARTLSKTSSVLEEPTYSHGGLVQVNETCSNCEHRNSYTRRTPRLEERTYTNDSSSRSTHSSGSSRGSSSLGSSSSSSGSSSFGGGYSSGGGASGRW